MSTTTQYPVEITSVVRKNKTFAINSFLTPANGYDGESPYKVYGKFSRFAVSILDFTGNIKKTAKANLRVSDIPAIVAKTQIALQQGMTKAMKGSSQPSEQLPSAYTVTFGMGTFKGKSPAQVILEGHGQELMKQREFLVKNLQKYPHNRNLVSAIDQAVELYRQGRLKPVSAPQADNNIIEIYKAGMHPLVRNKRTDGKCLVYDMSINWKMDSEYPVTITIQNYYATVIKKEDGRLNVTEIDNQTKMVTSISVTDAEWMDIIESIQRNMRMFEYLHSKELFNQAQNIYRSLTGKRQNSYQMPQKSYVTPQQNYSQYN